MPRTECIENLSPSWDETHYDMDLVGNDWLNLTHNSHVPDGPLPRHHAVRRQRRSIRSHALAAAGVLRSDRSAVLLRTGNAVYHQRHLALADPGQHRSEPHVSVRGDLVRTCLPADEPKRSGVAAADHLPRPDRRGNHLALLLPGQQRLPGELGRLERSRRSRAMCATFRSTTTSWPVRMRTSSCRRWSSSSAPAPPAWTSIRTTTCRTGAGRVQNIINALLTSAAWPDSAFILTYDEGGGLFDHVGPILVTPPDDLTAARTWGRMTRKGCSTSPDSACR